MEGSPYRKSSISWKGDGSLGLIPGFLEAGTWSAPVSGTRGPGSCLEAGANDTGNVDSCSLGIALVTRRLRKDQVTTRGSGGRARIRRSSCNPEVVGQPGDSPLDPETAFGTRRSRDRTWNPEVFEIVIHCFPWIQRSYRDPGVCIWTLRSHGNPEVLRDEPGGFFLRSGDLLIGTRGYRGNPEILEVETVGSSLDPNISDWNPEAIRETEGTVLRLPRRDYYRYLFGFCILPLGSWQLSSFYDVFYFCRKSLTGLEGAGVGVMTQVPGFAAFRFWRSRVLIAPRIS
ncbi:hypothetical protein F2Q69_00021671 [Brassica cretica]|uniref:Uncharacterized protein n=1 Tax=Brassica cretica TaxID=69181 RepID=A0A8S9QBL3_BRACR|nr:hypothetical protein F2Q69_00021671 [Brassica cretica]